MKLYVECMLKDVSKESFDVAGGDHVEYYVNTLKNSENEKLEVNSKSDRFKTHEGKWGVATVETREREKGGVRLVLTDFKEGVQMESDPGVSDIH